MPSTLSSSRSEIPRSTWAALVMWVALVGSLGLWDLYLDRRHPSWTLSHTWRDHGRLEKPVGEAVFFLVLGRLMWWFIPHMVGPARLSRAAGRMARAVPVLDAAEKK